VLSSYHPAMHPQVKLPKIYLCWVVLQLEQRLDHRKVQVPVLQV